MKISKILSDVYFFFQETRIPLTQRLNDITGHKILDALGDGFLGKIGNPEPPKGASPYYKTLVTISRTRTYHTRAK